MTSRQVERAVAARTARALAPTVGRLLRPRRPTAAELAAIAPVPAPKARGGVVLHAITQNTFTAPTFALAEGRMWPPISRMTMGAFLVEHEAATFLVDAGICQDAHTRHVPELPWLGRMLLAGHPPRMGLAKGIAEAGFDPATLAFVILTHLHWDHCSGLIELPGVPARLSAAEYDFGTRDQESLPGRCVIPETYSDTELQPLTLDGPPVETLAASHDVFGDGTVLVVSLPGHTPGHVGVLLTLRSGRRVLLAGDAVWSAEQVSWARQRAPIPSCLVDVDREETYRTVLRLHRLPAEITVLAAHDGTGIDRAFAGGPLR